MSDATNGDQVTTKADDASSRVRGIIDDYLQRRAAGEAVSREELIEEHAAVGELLTAEFEKLDRIDRARRLASTDGESDAASVETTLIVRCPHCHCQTEIESDYRSRHVTCSDCGQRFRLLGKSAKERVPRQLGRFELIDKLGDGSFGTVWRARDLELHREVALKTPRRRLMESVDVDELVREARFAAKLRHRHIVAIHEVGYDGDTVYIVSDLIRGTTLQEWAAANPTDFKATAALCRVIAEALAHAHDAGVVHRDLKPANVLMDEHAEPHLTDFGLAKHATDEISVTMDGHVLGTPAYMSPEQARGEAHLCDRRSDVYSLGVVLFELLTDELPFRGNMSVLTHKVLHDEPPSPRRLNRYVPRDLETVCLKCLEKEPRRRYQSAHELADELQRFCDDEPIHARPIGPVSRVLRWTKRQPKIAALSGTVLVLLMAIAALATWGYFRERGDRERIERLLAFIRQGDTVEDYRGRIVAAADSDALKRVLATAVADTDLKTTRDTLNDPTENSSLQLRQTFVTHAARAELQEWVDTQYAQSDANKVFAWFVQDPAGLQFARSPIGNDNIGNNYAWRTYFHGGDIDYADLPTYIASAGEQRLTEVKFSQPFVTQSTNQLVLCISAPVNRNDEFLGVVGVFLIVPDSPAGN